MENASKALIIAGAILISIVLVSVGVIVVNSLNPDDAVSTMSQQEIQSFNSKFDSCAGEKKQGSIVRSLLSTVITNNTTNANDLSKIVKITTTGFKDTTANKKNVSDSASLSTIRNKVNTSAKYDVVITYSTTGQVSLITITQK